MLNAVAARIATEKAKKENFAKNVRNLTSNIENTIFNAIAEEYYFGSMNVESYDYEVIVTVLKTLKGYGYDASFNQESYIIKINWKEKVLTKKE